MEILSTYKDDLDIRVVILDPRYGDVNNYPDIALKPKHVYYDKGLLKLIIDPYC